MALAAGVVAGLFALRFGQYTPYRAQLGISGIVAAILMLTGFELFHFAFGRSTYRLLSRGVRGLLIDAIHASGAFGLTLATVGYWHPSPFFCGGDLSAGFPAAFLCDALGESPISNWGNISWTDIPNYLGAFLDVLFFAALLWAGASLTKMTLRWEVKSDGLPNDAP